MARQRARIIGGKKHPENAFNSPQMVETTLAEGRINKGMITSLDPVDIENGALQRAKNARCRFDRVSRRFGTKLVTPDKPNGDKVLGLSYFKQNDGDEFFFRMTAGTIYQRTTGSWTAIPPAATALAGTEFDLPQFVTAFNRHFFVNNGANPIQEIDVAVPHYKVLNVSEATVKTEFRFLTSFYNRLVGAWRKGATPDPTYLGWSADAGITGNGLEEWDPAVNESAGGGPLVDSPGDTNDFISGIFGYTNYMLILREKSIWIAHKNPISSNPFDAKSAFPGIGCDCPNSVVVGLGKLMWLDTRTKTIWGYTAGEAPKPIGRQIEKDILRALDDKEKVFAGYNADENEYSIGIPLAGSTNLVRIWVYNERNDAWTYDEMEGVSRIADIPLATRGLRIADLPGKIDWLKGKINDLSPSGKSKFVRLYGRTDGEITTESEIHDRDPGLEGSSVKVTVIKTTQPVNRFASVVAAPLPGGILEEDSTFLEKTSGTYETDLISKDFEMEEVDVYVSRLVFKIKSYLSGTIRLEYSKNGKKFKVAATKDFKAKDIKKRRIFKFVKPMHCRTLTWRLLATSGLFDLEGYEIKVYPSGTYRE